MGYTIYNTLVVLILMIFGIFDSFQYRIDRENIVKVHEKQNIYFTNNECILSL